MTSLALKLLLTPLLIGAATLAARRWGGVRGGWIIALPLTSGPIVLFIATDYGASTAAAVAAGSIAGAIAVIAFCLGYAAVARRGWQVALTAGVVAFAVVAVLLPSIDPAILFVVESLCVVAGLRLLPRGARPDAMDRRTIPRWDLAARILVASVLVVTVTTLAPLLGDRLSGVLATFPVYVAVMAGFTHRALSATHAVVVLRGVLLGLIGLGAFYLALAVLFVPLGIALAFAIAIPILLIVHSLGYIILRGSPPGQPA
jgi:hypothetical protein